jgi:capsular exopolysaccharide synthesis family protein
MGKVYDALRRAEEQRSRRLHDAAETAPALDGFAAPRGALEDAPPRRRLGEVRLREEGGDVHNKRRIVLLQPESAVAEQFRSLRARLDALAISRPLRTIAVTSALPGDGKTMAAISLAAVSAMQLGSKVLLVECDLREPVIATSLGLRLDAGLSEVLTDGASVEQAIQRAHGSPLDVLAVRGVPQNPSELLASDAFRRLLEQLATRYERVILDLPPTLGLPDAKTVCELSDGTLFVVRADATPEGEIEAALDVLGRERLLGLVMNDSEYGTPYYKYGRD